MSLNALLTAWPWALVFIATLVWYGGILGGETLKRIAGRIGGYWVLIALIVIIDLIAAGRLGGDMGLPALFRDDPFPDDSSLAFFHRVVLGRAIWGACTATYLVALVWTIIYLSLFMDPANFKTLPKAYPPPAGPRLWDDRTRWAVPSQESGRFHDHHQAWKFLAATAPPFLLLLAMIGAFPADVLGTSEKTWTWARCGRALFEFFEYLVGIGIGVAVAAGFVRLAWRLIEPMGRFRRRVGIHELRNRVWPTDPEDGLQEAALSAAWGIFAINGVISILLWVFAVWPWSPSFAIGMLLCQVALGYFMLMGSPRPFRILIVVAVGLIMAKTNGDPYKYRFPGMSNAEGGSYYDRANLDRGGDADLRGTTKETLLDDTTVLNAWKKRLDDAAGAKPVGSEGVKPRLVLVAASGGGYRASFWTATVLDQLESRKNPDELPGLADRIRLIAGASGGMVGAAHYVALRNGGKSPAMVVDALRAETKLDSLSKVVQRLVQRDIPLIFWPRRYQQVDRGTVFEDEWTLLKDTKFVDLRAKESNGSIPSLIVSPMIVETGSRLLISNLNVDAVVAPTAESMIAYVPSGRVFFRRFPGAQQSFMLKTAARMSASFPYVLPAVNLPTDPPVRIVDAGYYDNFGVNLTAAWAYQNRKWIRENTSGLALIQINAFPRDLDPDTISRDDDLAVTAEDADRSKSAGDEASKANQGAFQWLSSPLEGGAAARDWSMFFRNEEQLRLLDDTFNVDLEANKVGKRFFERFVFTNDGQAAMNVIIGDADIQAMTKAFDAPDGLPAGKGADPKKFNNYLAMKQLVDWWHGRPIPVKAKKATAPPAPTNAFPASR